MSLDNYGDRFERHRFGPISSEMSFKTAENPKAIPKSKKLLESETS